MQELMHRCWREEPTERPKFNAILDKADEATDRRLARHLVSLHGPYANTSLQSAEVIEPGRLTADISRARTTAHQTVSKTL